jgi:hypothetical protein
MTPSAAAPTGSSPVRYGSRDGSAAPGGQPGCSLCGTARPSARARYCSAACRQRAYRERHPSPAVAEAATLRYRHTAAGGVAVSVAGRAVAHTIYECPLCAARSLGERRCADCNRFCRALGLGGACTHCDEPVLIADLLGKEVLL